MPAYTQAQAQAYYNTLSPDQKAAVDASGGPSVAWFTNSVNAGVPDAIMAAGGSALKGDAEIAGGAVANWQDAADSSEWLGKRKPTPGELRKWAAGQHAAYVSGDRTAQDEDYDRFSDRQLAAWVNDHWDVGKGGFFSASGQRIGKPTEGGGPLAPTTPAGGGGAAQPKGDGLLHQAKPVNEAGTQFLDLQRSLEDKFLGREDMFGFGDSRSPGSGEAGQQHAKSLIGGGLWWGSDKGMFDTLANKKKKKKNAGVAAPVLDPAAAATTAAATLPTSTPTQGSPLEQAMYNKFPTGYNRAGYPGGI